MVSACEAKVGCDDDGVELFCELDVQRIEHAQAGVSSPGPLEQWRERVANERNVRQAFDPPAHLMFGQMTSAFETGERRQNLGIEMGWCREFVAADASVNGATGVVGKQHIDHRRCVDDDSFGHEEPKS